MKLQPERFTPPPHSIYSCVKTRGFTLVEMSIVLVIIGLIVAGITVGKSLIHAAKLRSVIADINKYKIAINLYKIQYDALLGDHRNATLYWPTGDTSNGNGDGKITPYYLEGKDAWEHLSLAELIDGRYQGRSHTGNIGVTMPPSQFAGGGYMIDYNLSLSNRNYIQFGSADGGALDGSIISPPDAETIDKKIDNGKASSGDVRTVPGIVVGFPVSGCVSGSPSAYVLDKNDSLCSMLFLFD